MNSAFAPRTYSHLAVTSADELMFGVAPRPVLCGFGLEIGAGKVYPEVNFTLPTMSLTDETWPEVCAHYNEIGRQVLARAARLKSPGLVLEFELLPAVTERPEWGAELPASSSRIWRRRIKRAGCRGPFELRQPTSERMASHHKCGAATPMSSFVARSNSTPRPVRISCRSSRSAATKCTTQRS